MKLSELKLPARASLWYTISVVLGRGVGFLFTPVFTRILSERSYGVYTLYMSWIGIFTIISTFEIGGAVYMRAMQKAEDKEKLLRSACLLEFLLVSTVCLFYFAFYPYTSTLTELGVFMSSVMFMQIFFTSVISLYLASSKFKYNYRVVFWTNVLTGILPILLGIIMLRLFNVQLYAKILAQLVVSFIAFVILIYIIFKREKSISPKMMLGLLRSSLSYFPHYISIALISRADKLFISSAYGKEALARYSIADMVGSLLLFCASAPLSALSPWILRKLSSKNHRTVRDVSEISCRIITWLSLALLAIAPEIMSFLAPDAYSEALFAAYPIAVSAIPYFSFAIVSVALSHGGGFIASLPSVAGGTSAVLLSFIFSRFPHFSYVAFAIPISYLIMLLSSLPIARRRGISEILNVKNSLSLTLFCTLVALSLFLMRSSLTLRIVTLVLISVPLLIDFGRGVQLVKE